MSDKDQFTFEDEDDSPKVDRDDTNQPQEPELSFEDSSEPSLDDQSEFSGLCRRAGVFLFRKSQLVFSGAIKAQYSRSILLSRRLCC